MATFTRPPESCIGARKPHHTQRYCYLQTCNTLKTHSHVCFPPTSSPSYKTWPYSSYLVTKEKMVSPFDHDPTLPQHWSEHPRDNLGQIATPYPPSSLVSLFASPFTMKTPCIQQQGMQITLLPLAQRQQLPSCFFPPGIKG